MSGSVPPPIPKPHRVPLAQPRKWITWEMVFRGLTSLAIVAALVLALWSVFGVWFPVQQKSQELTAEVSRLSASTDHLERKWSEADAARIRAEYSEVHTNLFADEAALNEWMAHLRTQTAPLNLGVRVNIEKPTPVPGNEEELALIPATVSVSISPDHNSDQSPYQRLLRLTQKLGGVGKRADLIELTVEGGPSSVHQAVLVFRLWASESEQQ